MDYAIYVARTQKELRVTLTKESEWRFNHRHDNLYRLLLKILRSHPL